jgi:hypothetical protein
MDQPSKSRPCHLIGFAHDATPDATKINRYIALCGQYRREQDVFRAELVDAGKNPDPSGQ